MLALFVFVVGVSKQNRNLTHPPKLSNPARELANPTQVTGRWRVSAP